VSPLSCRILWHSTSLVLSSKDGCLTSLLFFLSVYSIVCQNTTIARTWRAAGSRRLRRTRPSSRASAPWHPRWPWLKAPLSGSVFSQTLHHPSVHPLSIAILLHCIIIIITGPYRLPRWRILLGLCYLSTLTDAFSRIVIPHYDPLPSPPLLPYPFTIFRLVIPQALNFFLPYRPNLYDAFHAFIIGLSCDHSVH
jgi:hypothetical protein